MLKGLPQRIDGQSRQDFGTIVDSFKYAVDNKPEQLALVFNKERVNYREYGKAASRVAGFLIKKNIQIGDRVIICINVSINLPVIIFGVLAARAQITMINPNYKEREITPLIDTSKPSLIFCDDKSFENLKNIKSLDQSILVNINRPKNTWQDLNRTILPSNLPEGKDDAAIMFTGGTTGISKGVSHNHFKIISSIELIEDRWPTNLNTEVLLNIPPLFHITGLFHGCFQPVYGCNTLILLPKFHPENVLEAIDNLLVSIIIIGAPTAYSALMSHPKFNKADFSTIKFACGGGAPLAGKVRAEWEERTGVPALEGYGMTEGAPTCNNPLIGQRKSYSVGKPVACTNLRIVDIETGTKEVPIGESGEIIIKGPHIADGYLENNEATYETFKNGWLHTGDIAYMDKDGFVFIIDRLKDMAIVSGFNVFPREIDEVLMAHPKIYEAAALGIPDEYRGEKIKAFISLHEEETLTEKDLISYCSDRLVKYKVPTIFEFTRNLPKTPVGKIDKRLLKKNPINQTK